MALKDHWSGSLAGAALLCASITMSGAISWSQQGGPHQPPVQRDDPATSEAGRTSGASGQFDCDPPKDWPPITTDARGVTTTHPKSNGAKINDAKTDAPADYGNESMGATTPK
jgi:hypothetical protein